MALQFLETALIVLFFLAAVVAGLLAIATCLLPKADVRPRRKNDADEGNSNG